MIIILSSVVLVISIAYYFTLVKSKMVTDEFFLKVRSQKNGTVLISTMESMKYISDYAIEPVDETTVNVNVYTTTIYNLFSGKATEINISLDEKIKYLIIAGKTIKRDSLIAN